MLLVGWKDGRPPCKKFYHKSSLTWTKMVPLETRVLSMVPFVVLDGILSVGECLCPMSAVDCDVSMWWCTPGTHFSWWNATSQPCNSSMTFSLLRNCSRQKDPKCSILCCTKQLGLVDIWLHVGYQEIQKLFRSDTSGTWLYNPLLSRCNL